MVVWENFATKRQLKIFMPNKLLCTVIILYKRSEQRWILVIGPEIAQIFESKFVERGSKKNKIKIYRRGTLNNSSFKTEDGHFLAPFELILEALLFSL